MPEYPVANTAGLAALAGTRTGGLGLHVPRNPLDDIYKQVQLAQSQQQLNADTYTKLSGQEVQDRIGTGQINATLRGQDLDHGDNTRRSDLLEKQLTQQSEGIDYNKDYQNAMISQLQDHSKELASKLNQQEIQHLFGVSHTLATMPLDYLAKNKESILDGLVKTQVITDKQGESLKELGPEQLQTLSKAALLSTIDASKLMSKGKDNKTVGTTKIFDPESGKLVYESAPLDKTNTTNTIKEGTDADESLKSLEQIGNQFKNDYLGYGGQGKGALLATRDQLSTVPIVGDLTSLNDKDKDWLKSYSGFRSSSEAMAMSVIKQLSGVQYSDKQLEFMKKIIPSPDDSPSQFNGKFDSMIERLNNLKDLKANLLKQGYRVDSEEYANKFLNTAQSFLNKPNEVDNSDIVGKDGKVYTTDIIAKVAADRKLPMEDIIRQIRMPTQETTTQASVQPISNAGPADYAPRTNASSSPMPIISNTENVIPTSPVVQSPTTSLVDLSGRSINDPVYNKLSPREKLAYQKQFNDYEKSLQGG